MVLVCPRKVAEIRPNHSKTVFQESHGSGHPVKQRRVRSCFQVLPVRQNSQYRFASLLRPAVCSGHSRKPKAWALGSKCSEGQMGSYEVTRRRYCDADATMAVPEPY